MFLNIIITPNERDILINYSRVFLLRQIWIVKYYSEVPNKRVTFFEKFPYTRLLGTTRLFYFQNGYFFKKKNGDFMNHIIK